MKPQPYIQGVRAPAGVAYGLEFHGPAFGAGALPAGLMTPVGTELPRVQIAHDHALPRDRQPVIDHEQAHFQLADGVRVLSIGRRVGRAVFHGPGLSSDELVHPYLARVASVYSRWLGREVFHGGALVMAGGVWPLLGATQAGKSTLLAAFVARGGEVLTDDLVVVEGNRVFAGPRCVDLRASSVSGAAVAPSVSPVRAGTRWRVTLKPVERCVSLSGWVFLSWGERLEMRPIGAAECLGRLAAWRARRQLASDPAQMLALAGAPAFVLTRPRGWDTLQSTLDRLVSVMVAAEPAGAR